MSQVQTEPLRPNPEFAVVATRERLESTAEALRSHGMRVLVAADRSEARRLVLEELPDGARVHQGASATLDALGVTEEIVPRLAAMTIKDACLATNPRAAGVPDIEALFRAAL